MNCPFCQTPMIASPMFGDIVTVTHTCPHCQHRHVASFNRPEQEYNPFAPKKPIIRTGQVFTMRFMNETSHHWIIAQETSRLGRQQYILADWNSHANRFMTISEDDLMCKRGSFSNASYPMPESAKAAARAFRLMRLIRLVHRSIKRISSGLVHCQQILAQTAYRGAFDMHDKTGYAMMDDEPDFLFGNEQIKKERIALQKKLAAMLREEMTLAGIPL